MIAIDDNFKISENGGTGNATIFVSATDKNLFSTASTQVEVSTSVGGNIKRYVTLNKKAAHGYMYTPVEWISNENLNSDCWIDLGYVWNNNSRAQFKGAYGTSNGNEWFGERITNWNSGGPVDDNGDLRWMYNDSTRTMYWDVPSGKRVEKTSYTPSTPFELEIGNFYIKNLQTGSNLVTGSTYNVSRTNTVGLFSASGGGGVIDKIKFYYIKIYEGNTLIMDIIPVLDKDNIPCFFDKVGEQFYYYKVNGVPSTGLTAGNIAYYTSDYLQGNGSDYVDIGYVPNSSTSIEIDFEGDSADLFGATNSGASNGMFGYFDGDGWNWRYANRCGNFAQSTFSGRTLYKMTPSGDYVNNVQKNSWSGSWSYTSASFYIFGIHRECTGLSNNVFNGKIYGVKIYEGNTLVREYIPYKSYGNVGLYEKNNDIFYPSQKNTMTQNGNVQPVVEKVVYTESDITISNETPSTAISVGNTFNLNTSTTPTGATLTYSSSDTSIATVDSNGVITAVGKGNATITITAQAFQDNTNHIYYNTTSKTVSVECAYPTQQIVITNSTPSEAINPNDTFDLNASTTPTGITLTYSSSDTSVATVNSNGVITGVATGTTTITITAQGFDDDVNKVHYNTTSKTVSVEVQEATPTPAWDDDFLTIEALNSSTTVQLKNPSNKNIWYRKDNQTEYTKIPTGDTSITIENANGYIKLYGDNEAVGTNLNTTAFNIYCEMNCNCYGKVTSLLSSGCPETISSTYTFSRLFRQSLIVDARGLILPNNVTGNCYYEMFRSCTSLVTPPQLPATTLAQGCYSGMFWGCTSLSQAPSLPVTSLAMQCYQNMFRECTSLTQAPQLPATSLPMQCYSSMFWGCTSLSQAPSLPATSLALSCYQSMFGYCSSLTTAPELPATTLAQGCYSSMFYDCTSLSQAPSLPATTLAQGCYSSMFYDCTSLSQAPSLPATTLTPSCYSGMFRGCTSLSQAPSLPVTTLAEHCYSSMFWGCTSLSQAPSLPATSLALSCYQSMFRNCSNLSTVNLYYTGSAPTTSQGYFYNWLQNAGGTGCTIYAPTNALWNSTDSTMNIPSKWTVEKTL